MKQITFCLLSLVYFTATAQIKVKPEDAAKHVGDSVSVCGKVYGGVYLEHSKGQPTLINVGAAYPNAPFTAVIFQEARALFTTAPEVYYKDSTVCITGRVALYNGKPQIVVNSPKQISSVRELGMERPFSQGEDEGRNVGIVAGTLDRYYADSSSYPSNLSQLTSEQARKAIAALGSRLAYTRDSNEAFTLRFAGQDGRLNTGDDRIHKSVKGNKVSN